MKKHLTLFAMVMLSMLGIGQNNVNLVIFSEDLEPFYAYVNGIRQNDKPETNVRIAGISPNIALRVEFTNKALPVIKQNMALEPGFEHTARLKYDKNKAMKLRYFGQVPMEQAAAPGAVSTVSYHTSENPVVTNTSLNTNVNSSTDGGSVNTSMGGMHSNVSVTSTTTTTKVNNGKSDNAQMNVTMPGVNISMNVTDPAMNSDIQTTTGTTVTTTSSSSSSSSSDGSYNQGQHHSQHHQPVPAPAPANAGCSVAMSPSSFSKLKASVEAKPFSDTKMSTAKIATKNNCLSVSQVMEIAKLFSMDDDKLAYAKYAYDYCTEKGNYYQVSEIFSFSSTTDEFNKFLDK